MFRIYIANFALGAQRLSSRSSSAEFLIDPSDPNDQSYRGSETHLLLAGNERVRSVPSLPEKVYPRSIVDLRTCLNSILLSLHCNILR